MGEAGQGKTYRPILILTTASDHPLPSGWQWCGLTARSGTWSTEVSVSLSVLGPKVAFNHPEQGDIVVPFAVVMAVVNRTSAEFVLRRSVSRG